jgi:cytochrome b561
MTMQWNNTSDRYGAGPRLLHWAIAVLVIVALVFIETRGYAPRGSALRRGLRDWHQQAGLVAFILLWLRVVFRLRNTPPDIVPPLPEWQRRAGALLHGLFYALLIALPVLGIVMVQTDERTVSLFGAELPRFIAPDKALTRTLEDVHGFLGDVMIAAIVAHVSAALWHHFVQRDNTLRRML